MKCGLLLSGCGFQDGSEIQETVFCLQSLEKRGLEVIPLSVSGEQRKVVHHNTGETLDGVRGVIEESARIVRGGVEDIKYFDLSTLDALVIPGGFGCALNLSDFAEKGDEMSVHPEVERLIRSCFERGKPIGAVCIAPVLIAKVLGEHKPLITVGDNGEVEGVLESLGARTRKCSEGSFVLDETHKIASTPAYMYGETNSVFVSEGIERMCEALFRN